MVRRPKELYLKTGEFEAHLIERGQGLASDMCGKRCSLVCSIGYDKKSGKKTVAFTFATPLLSRLKF